MAAIDDLINQISDESLRERIRAEVKRANKQKKFGLVFEEHIPEATPLYDVPVKRGSTVAKRGGEITDLYTVLSIEDGLASCIQRVTKEQVAMPVETLVSVALFGEPIYPYLKPIDSVCNAPDNDLWHTLIEADNYHALQLLEYLYAGKVDCIYIDPPYNTGARDWKYNNDYVDSTDTYRHSKWLSFMEKRLKLAQKLLNPKDSVLIVTIDEKEFLHLGCLLEELFPEANIQMVSSVISRKGSMRRNEFSRCAEYIFFVMFGDAAPSDSSTDMSGTGTESDNENPVTWQYLKRRGTSYGASRKGRPGLFYPIFIDRQTETFHSVGEPIPANMDRKKVVAPEGTWAAWPLRPNGEEGVWQVQPSRFLEQLNDGTCYLSSVDEVTETAQFLYLKNQDRQKVLSGKVEILGREPSGKLILGQEEGGKKVRPKDVWVMEYHDATHGTNLLNSIFVDKRFAYPKSLYAEHDTIKFFVENKPNAIVLDFFAGSGTTLHAVNLLNAEDGGHRQCILVTNNEVSDAEAKEMTKRGVQPVDDEWVNLGIAHYVTWPRTVCSIEGHDVNGQPLKGNYLGSDIPMADGFSANAAFFKLGFLDKNAVALGRQFKELMPLLWLKAGAHGPCPSLESAEPPAMLVLPENHFAVLTDEAQYETFAAQVNKEAAVETVYIVTDSEAGYREMIDGLVADDTYQLYRDYLDNFRINYGGR